MIKTEKWYQRRLAKYFTEHYEQYEDSVEYWNDLISADRLVSCGVVNGRKLYTLDKRYI